MECTVSVRIPQDELKEIERISKFENATKSSILREVLNLGIKEKILSLALKLFQNKKISAWKASRLADIPLTEFLDHLKKNGLEFNYTQEELEEDFKHAK